MISFFRELAVLPLKIALETLRILRTNVSTQTALIPWIWKIGHEIEWAHWYIVSTWRFHGKEKARELAGKLLLEEKNAYIAYFIGDLEFHAEKDIEAAKQWIRRAEALHCCCPEVLLYLKLRMSSAVAEYDDENLVQQILDRKDLSMEESRYAFLIKTRQMIRQKKWDQADDILNYMLRIESNYWIHIYKWITSLALQDEDSAQKHWGEAQKVCDQQWLYISQAIGLYWLGRIDQARDAMKKGIRDQEHLSEILFFQPYLAELIKASDIEGLQINQNGH